MATYTDNYQLTKPLYSETANVSVINDNMDKVDDIMHNSQISLADAYDQTQTYELGEKVMYEMLLYRCISKIETPEVWNPSHWERTTAADEGGNYVDVDEKFQTGLNVADVDIDGDQHSIKVPYMTGATSQADGAGGLVPAPEAGDEDKFFKGDGTWGKVISGETVYGEASGAIASFEDGTANPLEEFVIGIEPVQAGTGDPSPQNDRPLSGWTGANICNINDTSKQSLFRGLTTGTYGFVDFGTLNWTNDLTDCVYTTISTRLSGSQNGTANGLTQSASTVTTSNMPYNSFKLSGSNKAVLVKMSGLNAANARTMLSGIYLIYELETPTTPTITPIEFSNLLTAFGISGSIIPISWQDEAGTVYGGTVDVLNGKLTNKSKKITLRADTPTLQCPNAGNIWVLPTDVIIPPTSTADLVKCTHYKSVTQSSTENYSIAKIFGNKVIRIIDSTNATDLATYKAYLESQYTNGTPVEICYTIADPIEYEITSETITSLLGSNNIWADTGDVINCKYIRDLNSTINILWNAVFNQSNTRSLSLMKSVMNTDTKEIEEETEEEETEKEVQKEIKKEGNTDENQR